MAMSEDEIKEMEKDARYWKRQPIIWLVLVGINVVIALWNDNWYAALAWLVALYAGHSWLRLVPRYHRLHDGLWRARDRYRDLMSQTPSDA